MLVGLCSIVFIVSTLEPWGLFWLLGDTLREGHATVHNHIFIDLGMILGVKFESFINFFNARMGSLPFVVPGMFRESFLH